MRKEKKSTFLSLKSRLKSFIFASRGNFYAIKSQANLWFHLVAFIAVIALGFFFKTSTAEWLFIIFAICFLKGAESFKSIFENIVDFEKPEGQKFAQQLKDPIVFSVPFKNNSGHYNWLINFLTENYQ